MTGQILGWLGALLYLASHIYLSAQWHYNHRLYLAINLLAAFGVGLNSALIQSWQPVATNSFWIVCTLLAFGYNRDEGTRLKLPMFVLPLFALGVVGSAGYALFDFNISISVLGWLGVVIYSASYLQFLAGRITRKAYLAWHILAGFILMPVLWISRDFPALALQIVWVIISFWGLVVYKPTVRDALPPT